MKAIEQLISQKVIIRSDGAGIFYGTLNEVERGAETYTVELLNCRRIFYWEGACTMTQLAVEGTMAPDKCKFTLREESVVVTSVVEIHKCSDRAIESIENVPEWKITN